MPETAIERTIRPMEPLEFRAYIESIGFSLVDVTVCLDVSPKHLSEMCNGRRTPASGLIERLEPFATLRDRLADRLIDANADNPRPTLPYDASRTWEAHLVDRAAHLAAWTLEGDGKTVAYMPCDAGRIIRDEQRRIRMEGVTV